MKTIILIFILFFINTPEDPVNKLVTAAANGNISKIASILEKGVDIHAKNRARWNALGYACKYGYKDVVKFLVEKGAKVNEPVNTGSTPLSVTILEGHFDIANYLIDNKADFNIPDLLEMSPLMWAVKANQIKMVEFLVKNGARVNDVNQNGRSVLDLAIDDFIKKNI
ncbi:MAG: ankyrin repeat domain-containing protein [Bacteroidales bacterium]